MPSRLIHDTLLDSDAWLALSDKAARLYLSLFLMADDFGLLLMTKAFVARRAFSKRPGDAVLEKLIDELVAQDLLRLYYSAADKSVRYGFLPNYRQRLKQMRARYPIPPLEVYEDDSDAFEKFQTNKGLFEKMVPSRRKPPAKSAPSLARRETKGRDCHSEENSNRSDRTEHGGARVKTTPPLDASVLLLASSFGAARGQVPDNDAERKAKKPSTTEEWANFLNVKRLPDEDDGRFALRVANVRISSDSLGKDTPRESNSSANCLDELLSKDGNMDQKSNRAS